MKRFIHRHQGVSTPKAIILGGIGAAAVIAILLLATDYTHAALLIAPFGASCVLLFATPHVPFSQPANVIGGHVMAAGIGLGSFALLPSGIVATGFAVGLSVAAMAAFRLVHPPAGATALLAATAKGWGFLFFPVLTGSVALVVLAVFYHRLSGTIYPLHLPESSPAPAPDKVPDSAAP